MHGDVDRFGIHSWCHNRAQQVTLMLYGHNHRLERIAATFQNQTTMHSVPTTQADGSTVNLYTRCVCVCSIAGWWLWYSVFEACSHSLFCSAWLFSPRSTVHYVAGTAGASYSQNDCTTLKCTNPSWSEFVAYEHGYLRFSALNATALAYEYVVSKSNQVIDRNLIIQVSPSAIGLNFCAFRVVYPFFSLRVWSHASSRGVLKSN